MTGMTQEQITYIKILLNQYLTKVSDESERQKIISYMKTIDELSIKKENDSFYIKVKSS